MNAMTEAAVIKQHLIDPEVCIRCNTCEATCPVGAITHDSRNYVVDASKCNLCMACVPPCPTGSIDHWHEVVRVQAYTVAEQLTWDELPGLVSADVLAAATAAALGADAAVATAAPALQAVPAAAMEAAPAVVSSFGSTVPPWSAAHPYTNLYGPKAAQKTLTATVVGNVRVTAVGKDYDTHHLVLDFGSTPFPVLEGQSIGVVPPGVDASGRSHHARQYSVASPRNGERPGYNNLSLTIKRVLEDHSGKPVRGVASNFMCDAKVGDTVQVIGPFGTSFLMPNHPKSHIVMICTGTGSAPMRAMTEWRRRMAEKKQGFESGRLLLFFGARSPEELPYFGPLQKLPGDFISTHFAYSRAAGQPKRYVQDAMRDRAADLVPLLSDPNAYFYVCGLKAMEEGVLAAMKDIATKAGLSWDSMGASMKQEGRLHLETY
jgi:benzoyl-CoA 2,3-epoxidase subunit A